MGSSPQSHPASAWARRVGALAASLFASLVVSAAVLLALAGAVAEGGCASGGVGPGAAHRVSEDPRYEGARRCLARATLVDRVEGAVAVVVPPRDPPAVVARSRLPPGVGEGALLVGGARDAACERAVRAYVRALRTASLATRDMGDALRLE